MNPLGSALADRLRTSDNHLVVLTEGVWQHHPWPEVLQRAENAAERLLDADVDAVGLVGEPTVEFIAAIFGAFLADAALSILPGPIRGADPGQWAQSTLARFDGIGVRRVLSNGTQFDGLA